MQSFNGHTPCKQTPMQEMQEFLYALRTPVPASPAELPRPSSWRARPGPFVVDIGVWQACKLLTNFTPHP